MSLLPQRILPPTEPWGKADADGVVIIDKNWWLLLYNLTAKILGSANPVPFGNYGGVYLLYTTTASSLTNVLIPGFTATIGRLDITSVANVTINSIAGGVDGQELTIRNANPKGGPILSFPASTMTNGFDASGTVTLAPRQKFTVRFYATESMWV